MRRRLSLLSFLTALLLIFVLPAATVSAATFTYEVRRNVCQSTGGDYGYGHLYFKVRLNEFGNSGANKFTFAAKAQHKNLGGSRWVTEYNYGTDTYTFPSNNQSYWYTMWYSYDPDDFAWHRIRVALKVWHGSTLLASRVVIVKYC
jgi:hypothetical protein